METNVLVWVETSKRPCHFRGFSFADGEKFPLDEVEHKGGKGRVRRAMDACLYKTINLFVRYATRILPLTVVYLFCCLVSIVAKCRKTPRDRFVLPFR